MSFRNDTLPPSIIFVVVETIETMVQNLRHFDRLTADVQYRAIGRVLDILPRVSLLACSNAEATVI